jgi:hypothetical protein
MLISQNKKYIKTPFNNEAELEKVIIDNYEYLFGPNSIFLPKALIKTADGAGTIPDGFAIDLEQKKWYLVEAELIHHNVWNHIAPQITKQLLASHQLMTKKAIEDLAVEQYQRVGITQEKFTELGINAIDVRKVVREILEKDPIIGVPIDDITTDLKDWARTLRYNVKLWIVRKFVDFNDNANIIFEFPEEFKPELDTEEESEPKPVNKEIAKYDIDIIDLIEAGLISSNEKLFMQYKPKNGYPKKYEATVLNDGSLQVLNQNFSSPSYAALAGIQDASSDRKTVNGWTSWRNSQGRSLAELREQLLNTPSLYQ